MREIEEVFAALDRSSFRSRFRLDEKDAAYLRRRGFEVVLEHGDRFVRERLAPASPPNDGRQTPWRGHPVFVAQHATATCCRSCLEKWHGIGQGSALEEPQIAYVLDVIRRWLWPTRSRSGIVTGNSPPANSRPPETHQPSFETFDD